MLQIQIKLNHSIKDSSKPIKSFNQRANIYIQLNTKKKERKQEKKGLTVMPDVVSKALCFSGGIFKSFSTSVQHFTYFTP